MAYCIECKVYAHYNSVLCGGCLDKKLDEKEKQTASKIIEMLENNLYVSYDQGDVIHFKVINDIKKEYGVN